jgi:hypothetical protein
MFRILRCRWTAAILIPWVSFAAGVACAATFQAAVAKPIDPACDCVSAVNEPLHGPCITNVDERAAHVALSVKPGTYCVGTHTFAALRIRPTVPSANAYLAMQSHHRQMSLLTDYVRLQI